MSECPSSVEWGYDCRKCNINHDAETIQPTYVTLRCLSISGRDFVNSHSFIFLKFGSFGAKWKKKLTEVNNRIQMCAAYSGAYLELSLWRDACAQMFGSEIQHFALSPPHSLFSGTACVSKGTTCSELLVLTTYPNELIASLWHDLQAAARVLLLPLVAALLNAALFQLRWDVNAPRSTTETLHHK